MDTMAVMLARGGRTVVAAHARAPGQFVSSAEFQEHAWAATGALAVGADARSAGALQVARALLGATFRPPSPRGTC